MATHIARNDAQIIRQVSTATPAAVTDTSTYGLKINGKLATLFTSGVGTDAQEIVEGVKAIMAAYTAAQFPEAKEITWTEDDAMVIATGPTNGKPFTVLNNAASDVDLTVATPTTAKSPNHWIAENFDSGTLPVSTDSVILSQLTSDRGFYWGLDQNAVNLALLDVKADFEGDIGLPEYNRESTAYYQATYRDTHLKISVDDLRIGEGSGAGSRRCKINLGAAVDCDATIYNTSQSPYDQDEAPVHLVGGTAGSTLQLMAGWVDLAMLPGYTGSWGTIVVNGGKLRCGGGVTLGDITVQGTIETRTAVTNYSIRPGATATHIGAVGITTANVQSKLHVQSTGALIIGTLNGYSGGSLDLSKCDANVTITNMTIYAASDSPFVINDPNNKLVMTNAASTPNGAQSLRINTGSGRNVRIT